MEKIKVLRIINRFNIGGPTYNATFLSAFLSEEFETLLVGGLPEEGESDSLYIPEKYNVQPLLIEELVRTPNYKSDRKAYKRLKEIMREFKPDIVHTHASKAGALGRKAAFACKVPVVIHTFHGHVFHSYFGKLKTGLFKAIERSLAKRSTGIVAISDRQKEELSVIHRICPPDKIKVIPLGFDLLPFHEKRTSHRKETRENFGIHRDEIAVGIIGRLAPIKNHDLFLDVCIEVLEKTTKKVKVFIVGDGSERAHIEGRVQEINERFGDQLTMTSWIKDIGAFNAGMDVICLTSNNEGTPVSMIEAQAGGIPVISTNVGGVCDVIQDGETGYIVPPNDLAAFAKKLLELIENENIRTKMSQNGWKFVEERFNYTTLVRNMEAYYKQLLKQKSK